MRFLVLMAEEDHFDKWEAASEQEQQAFFDGLAAFTAAVRDRGEVLFGDALARPERAQTVRGGSTTEGPYAETVEQVGGFYVVDLPPRSSPWRPRGCSRCRRSRSARYSTCDLPNRGARDRAA